MVSPNEDGRECTVFCKSVQHASQAVDCVVGIVRSGATVDEVKVYLRHLCWNFHSLTDAFGRTVLHAAASVGNVELIEWLIDVYDCDPNRADAESGWSALHRAAFFGQLGAIWVLLQKGASVDLKDHDGLTPLDIIVRDRVPWADYVLSNRCSLHIWGEDENLSLGLGSTTIAGTPKTHPKFSLDSGINSVVIEKFHSAFLAENNKVFVCGNGSGGRLGTGDESALMVPGEVPVFRRHHVKVVQVAAGQDHTLFLDSEGNVYSCGSNKYHQLGFSARPSKLLEPLALNAKTFLLNSSETIKGVGAAKYHSALFTERALYTWGLNAGQLGHPKLGERFTVIPRKVSGIDLPFENISSPSISMISCGEGAIGLLTTDGDVYLVHDYHVKKVVSKLRDITKIAVVGGNIDHERLLGEASKCTDLKLLTLNDSGYMLLWGGRDLLHSRICFEIIVRVVDFAVSIDGSLLIVSKMGEVFSGRLGRSVSNVEVGWSSKSRSKKHCSRTVAVNELRRVPHLHRAVAVACDPRGKRFAALQNGANEGVRSMHNFSIERSTFVDDLTKMVECGSSFSDIVVTCVSPEKAQLRNFDLHSMVLRSRSAFFEEIISSICCEEKSEVSMKTTIDVSPPSTDVDGDEFSTVIPMIYSGVLGSSETLLKHGDLLYKLQLNLSSALRRDVATDVRILSQDGDGVDAHRCILAARSEYFNCMFCSDWQEASSRQFTMPVPTETLLAAIDFLYTDACPAVRASRDINFVCDVLAFADHLLISRLKSICENELFSRLVNVQNVCELFELAKCYQADKLLQVCADFICVNLTGILESQCFDYLSMDSWEGLSVEYRASVQDCHKRVMGGNGREPSKESIQQVYKSFKSVLGDDRALIKTAETRRIVQPNKKKIYSPPKRRFERPKAAESAIEVAEVVGIVESGPIPRATVALEGFPALGEIQLEKKQPRGSPMTFKQASQRTQKRTKHRSIDSLTPSEAVAISKCPWSPNNKSEAGDSTLVNTSHSLEETMKLETRYKEQIANFSLDKADAEDRAMADLAIVYEIGFNPDERVSIQRETLGETLTVPVWSSHGFN